MHSPQGDAKVDAYASSSTDNSASADKAATVGTAALKTAYAHSIATNVCTTQGS